MNIVVHQSQNTGRDWKPFFLGGPILFLASMFGLQKWYLFLPNKYWWKKYATNLECFFFILTWVFGIKHILPYLEIVKCFTPARFPNLLISPGKTSQSRHFWLKFIMEDVLLLCLVQITSFCAIMLAWIQQIIQGVPKKWCIAILLWFPLKLLI